METTLNQSPESTDTFDTFEQEFNKAVDILDGVQASTPQVKDDIQSNDNSSTQIQSQQDTDLENLTLPVGDSDQQTTTGNDDKKEKAELEQVKAYYEQQLSLANGRLRDVASQYQAIKSQFNTPKGPTTRTDEISSNEELLGKPLPSIEEAKKILSNDPEYAGALMRIFNTQLETIKNSVNNEVRNQITPVYQQMRLTEAQKHKQAINQAHPDADQLLSSGEVVTWISSLPTMYRQGAERVFKQGTTEEAIALLNEYKTHKQNKVDTNANSKSESQSTSDNGASPKKSSSKSGKESEDLISRIKGGLTVPSGKSESLVENNQPKKTLNEEDEFNKVADSLHKGRNALFVSNRRF